MAAGRNVTHCPTCTCQVEQVVTCVVCGREHGAWSTAGYVLLFHPDGSETGYCAEHAPSPWREAGR